MNQLSVKVIHIQQVETLYYLTCQLGKQHIYILILELNPNIEVNSQIRVSIKSTNIVLSKEKKALNSFDNLLIGQILAIENGQILSSISLDLEGFKIESIVTVSASKRMNLQINSKISLLFNASDVSIDI